MYIDQSQLSSEKEKENFENIEMQIRYLKKKLS